MYIGTHVCLPLVALSTIDIIRLKLDKQTYLNAFQLFLVAIAGFLPDILTPHTSMAGRLSSWSHTIWFLLALLPIVYFVSRKYMRRNYLFFAIAFWIASVLHVFVDMISGGISWIYPIESVIGASIIPWRIWVHSDILFVIVLAMLLLIRYKLRLSTDK